MAMNPRRFEWTAANLLEIAATAPEKRAIKINAKVLSGDEHFKLIANPDKYGIPSELQYLKGYVEYIKEEEN